jgi:hypothetical protein
MNAFNEVAPLKVRAGQDSLVLISEEETVGIEARLLAALDALPIGGLLALDLDGVQLSSESARQLLRRAIRRVCSGELDDRFLILQNLKRGRYSVEAMLKLEGLTVAERVAEGRSPALLGKVDQVVRETYEFLVRKGDATARDLVEEFELKTVSAATNRLTTLSGLGLARKVAQEGLPGGGIQYRFAPVR